MLVIETSVDQAVWDLRDKAEPEKFWGSVCGVNRILTGWKWNKIQLDYPCVSLFSQELHRRL
ncbi:MAG: hypothetical protein NPIRA02_05890 [Nitrospirales bacterium]|nr:MAG: hypothetical protein NPIRA02_05890 [Nitrospirales bacterium]